MAKLILSEENENKRQLNEAFSPTMPDWLASALFSNLITTKYTDGVFSGDLPIGWEKDKRSNVKSKFSKKFDLDTYQPQYNIPKGRGSFHNHSLLDGIKDKNININKADFISGAVPTKGTDARLKGPFQPFFLLDVNGAKQVYAPGINDRERSIVPNPRNVGSEDTLGSIRFSELQPYIKEFCFVDLSDTDNLVSNYKDYKSQKTELQNQGVERYTKNDYDVPKEVDKSGYVNTNKARYAEFAKTLDYKGKLLDKIERSYDELDRLMKSVSKQDVYRILMSDEGESILNDIKSYYKNCISYLRNAKSYIESSIDYDTSDEYYYKNAVKYFNNSRQILELLEMSVDKLIDNPDGLEEIEWY